MKKRSNTKQPQPLAPHGATRLSVPLPQMAMSQHPQTIQASSFVLPQPVKLPSQGIQPAAHLSIPSFTGTTATEAMRYEQSFLTRLWRSTRKNNLLLMAGGVAYSTLLSIIPLVALMFAVLTVLFDETLVVKSLSTHLQFLVPGNSTLITKQLAYFLNHRGMFSGLNLLFLLFFSSMAFTMMENAMSVIFAYDKDSAKRRFWVSAAIPYFYIGLIFMGIIGLTIAATLLQGQQGWQYSPDSPTSAFLYMLGFVGLSLLLTTVYIIMPRCEVPFRKALLGGFVAATLWEVSRRALVYFFANISPIHDLYGPLATVIMVLVCLEIGALILLFGAQVIAEFERKRSFHKMVAPTLHTPIQIDPRLQG